MMKSIFVQISILHFQQKSKSRASVSCQAEYLRFLKVDFKTLALMEEITNLTNVRVLINDTIEKNRVTISS